MEKFLLDTVVFNRLVEGSHQIDSFSRRDVFFITHHQRDEIANTPIKSGEPAIPSTPSKREKLLSLLKAIDPVSIPTSASVWGVSNWGEGKWANERIRNLYKKMMAQLKELDKGGSRRKTDENQIRDVLTSLTAIENGMVLVTDDKNLSTVMQEFGGRVVSFEDFLNDHPHPNPPPSRGRKTF